MWACNPQKEKGENAHDFEIGNGFCDVTPKGQATKGKVDQMTP